MPRNSTVPQLLEELRTFLDERFAEFDQGDAWPRTFPAMRAASTSGP